MHPQAEEESICRAFFAGRGDLEGRSGGSFCSFSLCFDD